MSAPKSTNDPAQQKMAEKGRQAQQAKQSQQPNEIAQETNMKRQQKDMHKQTGKK